LTIAVVVSCGGQVGPASPGRGRSCNGAPGAGHDCGASGEVDCCAAASIPDGAFSRFNDPAFPATVSSFYLDEFEVTVGRFRAFVDAWPESRPKPGDGAHPKVAGSGWQSAWDTFLPVTADDLRASADCRGDPKVDPFVTWTRSPGPNERAPIACVSWYEAFAFCAWDGGRLPTLAEWDDVAVGGDEQRKYPWGSAPPDPSRAVLDFTPNGAFAPVGSAPAGASRWGVLDIGGSRGEYVRDGFHDTVPTTENPSRCDDCIIMNNFNEKWFGVRDAFFNNDPSLANVGEDPTTGTVTGDSRDVVTGIRCARDAPR